MSETVSARDANHDFARILREVEGGREFAVTRNGVPVARIIHMSLRVPHRPAADSPWMKLANPSWRAEAP